MTARAVHAMPFGASLRPAGGVDFALWAPAALEVALEWSPAAGSAARRVPAARDEGGWFRVGVEAAGPGTHYRWILDGERPVPDPASRFHPDGPHGPGEVVDAGAFEWDEDWLGQPWEDSVVYELHVGSFTPEGSYAAAAARLPSLAALGITVIELMPLGAWPGRFGWGYDGGLPFAPHAAYGRPEDLKAFVQAAHRIGLAVWLDVVYSHFGPLGRLFGRCAPELFSTRHRTAWGDAINFDGPGSAMVREFFVHNALYWLEEYRFDGLRLDAVQAIADDGPEHVLAAISRRVREALPGRQVHLVLGNEHFEPHRLGPPGAPGTFEAQWHEGFHHAMHVLLTGERHGDCEPYGEAPLAALARALTGQAALPSEVGSALEPADPAADGLPSTLPSRLVLFLQNHEQVGRRDRGERLSVLAGPESLRLATAIMLLAPSIPMLFMGEEHDERHPFLHFADGPSPLRDGRARALAALVDAEGGEPLPDPDPDPGDERRFALSRPDPHRAGAAGRARESEIAGWLALRRRWVAPRLAQLCAPGLAGAPAHAAWTLPGQRLVVRWHFDDGLVLELRAHCAADAEAWAVQDLPAPLASAVEIARVGDWQLARDGAVQAGPWSGSWSLGREAGATGAVDA